MWDKTFPKFEAESKRQAIQKYWDYYYDEAEKHEMHYPDFFRIFPIEAMSSRGGQREILNFIGVSDDSMVLKEKFHAHKSHAKKL